MKLTKNKMGQYCLENVPYTGKAWGVVAYYFGSREKMYDVSHLILFTEKSEVHNPMSYLGWEIESFELFEGVVQE